MTVGDEQGYVYYVSPTQINFIVPPNLPPGPQPVVVRNVNGSSSSVNTTVVSFAPAFFGWPNNQVVATGQDFSYAAASGTFSSLSVTPAKQGDVIILWGTGFGVTTPPTLPDIEVPSTVIYNTSTLPTVTIGNVSAKVFGTAPSHRALQAYIKLRFKCPRHWPMAFGPCKRPSAEFRRQPCLCWLLLGHR